MRILIVEDDQPVVSAIAARLHSHGYQVVTAPNVAAARRWLDDTIDVVLLDLGLPDGDGMRLCPYIRANSDAALLIVTARDAPDSRVQGLDLGADDYIVKPYDTRELLARMNAVLRRRAERSAGPAHDRAARDGPIRIQNVELDIAKRTVRVDDRSASLTKHEFDLLAALARERGLVVGYERLAHELWQATWPGVKRLLHVHVARIRTKIGRTDLIQTVRGVGYRIQDIS